MQQAHLVGVYTPDDLPEELNGFVRFQASLDGHEMRKGERIAVLNVIGTSSYVPVFLEGLKGYAELESKLSQHEVIADQVSKASLQRVLQELVSQQTP